MEAVNLLLKLKYLYVFAPNV